MNKIVRQIATVLLSVPVLLSVAACGRKQPVEIDPPETATAATLPASQKPSGVQTMLLMSLTDFQVPGSVKTLRNDRQVDFIMLMTIDADANTTTAVQIDPDIEVPFQHQGATQEEIMPLGEVFTYGSGGSDSNLNILMAVSKLMDNVKIDHYMTFDADSVSIMTDMLGGVTVNITDSFPEAYPELAKGGSVCLDGKNADVFFNYVAPEDRDNTSHMRRQQEFIRGVYGPFSSSAGQEEFVTQLSMKLGEKMNTDLTLSQMLKMMEALQEHKLDDDIQMVRKGDT